MVIGCCNYVGKLKTGASPLSLLESVHWTKGLVQPLCMHMVQLSYLGFFLFDLKFSLCIRVSFCCFEVRRDFLYFTRYRDEFVDSNKWCTCILIKSQCQLNPRSLGATPTLKISFQPAVHALNPYLLYLFCLDSRFRPSMRSIKFLLGWASIVDKLFLSILIIFPHSTSNSSQE